MTPSTTDIIREALHAQVRVRLQAIDRLNGRTQATIKARSDHSDAVEDMQAALAELDTEARRSTAVSAVINTLVSWCSSDGPQGHFTCGEADPFAELLRAYGRSTSAAAFLEVHADADNEPGDWHRSRAAVMAHKDAEDDFDAPGDPPRSYHPSDSTCNRTGTVPAPGIPTT